MCRRRCALSPPLSWGCNKAYRTLVPFVAVVQQHTKTGGDTFWSHLLAGTDMHKASPFYDFGGQNKNDR